MADMDMSGAAALRDLVSEVRDAGVDLRLARLHGAARTTADRMGVLDLVGADHVHTTVDEAVTATGVRG